jgi:hypothetical protein
MPKCSAKEKWIPSKLSEKSFSRIQGII